MQMGLFFVSSYDEAIVGVQTLDDLPDAEKLPACRTPLLPYADTVDLGGGHPDLLLYSSSLLLTSLAVRTFLQVPWG